MNWQCGACSPHGTKHSPSRCTSDSQFKLPTNTIKLVVTPSACPGTLFCTSTGQVALFREACDSAACVATPASSYCGPVGSSSRCSREDVESQKYHHHPYPGSTVAHLHPRRAVWTFAAATDSCWYELYCWLTGCAYADQQHCAVLLRWLVSRTRPHSQVERANLRWTWPVRGCSG
jgi:hypothetical protein